MDELRALLEANPVAKRAYDAEKEAHQGQLNLMRTRIAFQDAVIVQKDADFVGYRRSMDNVLSKLRRSVADIAALRWVLSSKMRSRRQQQRQQLRLWCAWDSHCD